MEGINKQTQGRNERRKERRKENRLSIGIKKKVYEGRT